MNRFRKILLSPYILSLIVSIRKLQQIQFDQNLRLKDEISQLQLQTIQNQMDPHFTFNVFSSIATIIRNKKSDIAYDFIMLDTADILYCKADRNYSTIYLGNERKKNLLNTITKRDFMNHLVISHLWHCICKQHKVFRNTKKQDFPKGN